MATPIIEYIFNGIDFVFFIHHHIFRTLGNLVANILVYHLEKLVLIGVKQLV